MARGCGTEGGSHCCDLEVVCSAHVTTIYSKLICYFWNSFRRNFCEVQWVNGTIIRAHFSCRCRFARRMMTCYWLVAAVYDTLSQCPRFLLLIEDISIFMMRKRGLLKQLILTILSFEKEMQRMSCFVSLPLWFLQISVISYWLR